MTVYKTVDLATHAKRVREIHDTLEPEIVNFLLQAGEAVRQDAMESIRRGTVRGRGHIPSLPGEPPKGDTGRLELNIQVELRRSEKSVNVISRAPYSSALEFGTAQIAERPFLRPALQRNKNKYVSGMTMIASGERAVRVFKGERGENGG